MSEQSSIRNLDFNKSHGIEMEILDLNKIYMRPKLFSGHNRANFLQLIWVKSGFLRVDIDFSPIYIYEDEVFLISINQVYNFHTDTEFEGKLIIFTLDFFNSTELDNHLLYWAELINPLYFNPKISLNRNFILPLVNLMEQELKCQKDFYQSFIVQSFLRILLLEIERTLNQTDEEQREHFDLRIGRSFCAKVGRDFKTHHNVAHYQLELGVSEKILTKGVRDFTGKTPKEYLEGRIILEAKRLLSFGKNLSVKEVGAELGFDEPTNFNKFFKKNTGVTPGEFSKSTIPDC